MGIKEYLTGKKQKEVKYRLSDIVWVHNMYIDGEKMAERAVNVPFIPNKDNMKYKNLLTNEIVELPIIFKGNRPIERTLCDSVGLDYDDNTCDTALSDVMLRKAFNMKGVSTKIIRDLGVYMAKNVARYMIRSKNEDLVCSVWDFCKETSFTQSQIVDFANSLTKERNIQNAKDNERRLKKEKEDTEYERDVRDF